MKTPDVIWDGGPTTLRSAVTRGSAAGGAYASESLHRMAGYTSDMLPVAACGLVFPDRYVLRSATRSDQGIRHCTRPGCNPHTTGACGISEAHSDEDHVR